mmetsp:Transcript_39251/g.89454  ORF Transcript_39251/g.89454 Transcript_39251/m.89454 type:complete len:333 (+) Transcript_39251:93-1091(+)
MVSRTQLVSLFVLGLVCACSGFYLPGVAPRKYVHGEQLTVKVNTLTSDLTPLQFDYYNIPFCEPKGGEKALAENLGEVLAGERTETSAYKCHTNVTRLCKVACRKVWTKENVDEFRDFAGAKYRANMRLDNLPGAELVVFRDQNGAEFVSYRLGYPIAEASDFNSTNFHINNHLRITIRYHNVERRGNQIDQIEEPGVLIVGFELKASSIDHRYEGKWDDKCAEHNTCDLFTCNPSRGPEPNAPRLKLKTHKKTGGGLHVRRPLGQVRRQVGVAVGRVPQDAVAGRRNPLVQYRELIGDPAVPVGDGGAHHAPHPPQRPLPLQPAGAIRGGA